jgi:hypothetical protein
MLMQPRKEVRSKSHLFCSHFHFSAYLPCAESLAPVQKLGAGYSLPRVALPSCNISASGYTEQHAFHAKDLKYYQTKVYASNMGQFGSIQGRIIVLSPGKVKAEIIVVRNLYSSSLSLIDCGIPSLSLLLMYRFTFQPLTSRLSYLMS